MSAGYCRIRSFLHQVTCKPKASSSERLFVPGIFLACYFAALLLCLYRGKLSLEHFPCKIPIKMIIVVPLSALLLTSFCNLLRLVVFSSLDHTYFLQSCM